MLGTKAPGDIGPVSLSEHCPDGLTFKVFLQPGKERAEQVHPCSAIDHRTTVDWSQWDPAESCGLLLSSIQQWVHWRWSLILSAVCPSAVLLCAHYWPCVIKLGCFGLGKGIWPSWAPIPLESVRKVWPQPWTKIKVLYEDIESVLKMNGVLCKPFKASRGIRQDFPMSGMIDALSVEHMLQSFCSYIDDDCFYLIL